MLFQNVTIESIGYELAPHRISSEWLEDQIDETMQRLHIPRGRIEDLTGIRERRFWNRGTMPSDVATLAARRAIELAGVDPARIGTIISTSVCRDYIEPSVACLVHGNLKLPASCMNYDVSNACLGFLNGMVHAAMMIEAGIIEYALIVDGEGSQEAVMATIRRLQSPTTTSQEFRENFATLTLGSGAVAMVLAHQRHSQTGHRINGVVTLAATEHNRLCYGQPEWMRTDAAALLIAGVQLAARTWQLAHATLPRWSDDAIALYAPHQVSARHTAAVAESMGVPLDKMFLNFPTLGNIGPAALPITLAQAVEAGRVRHGDTIGLLGIGSGLNCSMMSVTW
ncbi:MAG TPA: 3-oxoacyl-ACP synthase III [Roseiflexaceae bacterium]|nr:3-oxoacyl-ACP synthase III [Roseiflexaceae bacterium]HMP40562.1 3-oxoacyl-ACP synthase III [Roseiflexaceae bacterium]